MKDHLLAVTVNSRLLAASSNLLRCLKPPRFSSSTSGVDLLKQTHAKLLRNGELDDTLTAGKLVADIASSHPSNLPYAHSLFERIPPPLNAFIWNSMIRGYAHSAFPEESLSLYRSMLARGYSPNNYTFPFLLRASARLADHRVGLSLHASLVRRGLDRLDPFIQTSLVSFYASVGSVEVARWVFDHSPMKDVTSWNALMKGYIACDRHADALRLFRAMRGQVDADEITMLSVVSACAHLGALGVGRGFALNGLAKEALDLFSEMQLAGVNADSVTLTGVLSACSHAGLVDEGLRVLKRMKTDYHVEPAIEHYGCAVDLLGRAGRLEQALDLIRTSPMRPDVVVWGALLVACRVYKNLELGELVAREMLDLDPHHAGARVFLSNVYAASGEWDRVQEVRSSMKEQKIYKPPGSSLMEMGVRSHIQDDRRDREDAEPQGPQASNQGCANYTCESEYQNNTF
ncbi:Pentatricopeptide repeat-containing protein [Canna indica]|uniref:Pentatricopeptide repeat-containing protein n=1 Tax=Canna indica TaxID=4628 RepID=A0AAQ3QDQ7_9LILI|nr:Pentatricopeptide repeat-containing protein [Canna indica]